MKKTTSREELSEMLDAIITNTDDNVYFTHITGTGLNSLFFVKGQGILTREELVEQGYKNPEVDFEDEEVQMSAVSDKHYLNHIGLELNDEQIAELQEKYSQGAVRSFFEHGIYSEQNDIRSTATELRENAKEQIMKLITADSFSMTSRRGNMVLILEVPKEYIYGDKKEQLFQKAEGMEVASGTHAARFNQTIPNSFIKSAVIVELALENDKPTNEYFVLDNEYYKKQEKTVDLPKQINLLRSQMESYYKGQSMISIGEFNRKCSELGLDFNNEMQLARRRTSVKDKLEKYDELYTEQQFSLYDEVEELGLDFNQELNDAKSRNDLKSEIRKFVQKKSSMTVVEINTRCTQLGMNYNYEMAEARKVLGITPREADLARGSGVLSSAIEATEEVTTIGDIEQQAKNISTIEKGTINKNTQAIE